MLSSTHITIVGLGLMGGSLGAAMRGRCARITGVDVEPRAVAVALSRGAVEHGTTNLAEGVADADLVVLAVPVRASLRLLEELAGTVRQPLAVMDLGSTKRDVVTAMAGLPANFDPIGGHPMCGKERAGIEHADARLFDGAPFALSVLDRTSPKLRGLAEELVDAIGARPLFVDSERHDRLVSAVSHLPYLLSGALMRLAEAERDPRVWQLAGPGFRDTTRLAASDLTMMLDILATNRDFVLSHLSLMRSHLDDLASAINARDESALASLLTAGRDRRSTLFQRRPKEPRHDPSLWPGA